MARHVVVGNGLIARALKRKLGHYGWYPEQDTEYLFYFGGTTHPDFEKNKTYHEAVEMAEFSALLNYCVQNEVKFIYPSSALVYEKDTDFAKFKRLLENLGAQSPGTLGLRIFPVYGEEEEKTVISKWCRQMKEGRRPEVYGDGTQERDFIHVDDVVDQIMAFKNKTGVIDVGRGKPVSFNAIIDEINNQLGTHILPKYLPAPEGYSKGIYCKHAQYTKVDLSKGIKRMLNR